MLYYMSSKCVQNVFLWYVKILNTEIFKVTKHSSQAYKNSIDFNFVSRRPTSQTSKTINVNSPNLGLLVKA